MQMAVCEFARHVAGIPGAHSTEFDPSLDGAVIALMAEQEDVADKGGTMRLGAYDCDLVPDSLAGADLRSRPDLRAPSSPLRGQQPLS